MMRLQRKFVAVAHDVAHIERILAERVIDLKVLSNILKPHDNKNVVGNRVNFITVRKYYEL